jgi:hypothetical protein
MWAKCIDLHLDNDKLKRKTKPELIQHAKQLMSLYMTTKDRTRSASPANRKRGWSSDNAISNSCGYVNPEKMTKRSLDPKSNLIAKSAVLAASRKIDYSEVSVSEGSESLIASFGKRVQKKNGVVLVDVEITFAHNFPDVHF